jgi:hypothetical protein
MNRLLSLSCVAALMMGVGASNALAAATPQVEVEQPTAAKIASNLLATIRALPANTPEVVFEAQLAGVLDTSSAPDGLQRNGLQLALHAKDLVKPAEDALMALLRKRTRTGALGNGIGNPFGEQRFGVFNASSDYRP